VIVFNEASLRRHLKLFLEYYHQSRTHLFAGEGHAGVSIGAAGGGGRVVAVAEVGGLHHRYERRGA
jgi:hypothetical protein